MLKKIYPLKPENNEIFWTPIQEEDKEIIRTGTIGEGSCFFHSILTACSEEYNNKSINEKMSYVKDVREKIAEKVTKETWEKVGNGTISKVFFQENLLFILTDFYSYIETNNIKRTRSKRLIEYLSEDNLEFYRILIKLLPLKILEEEILPKAYNKSISLSIGENCLEIISSTIEYIKSMKNYNIINPNKKEYLIKNVKKWLTVILAETEEISYKKYVKNISNPSYTIGLDMMEFISDFFNRDIFIIDSNTRLPYVSLFSENNIKRRKSIVILWVNSNHYEILGVKTKNQIKRNFSHNNIFIDKIYSFLFDHNRIRRKYQDLIPFLFK